MSNKEHFPSFDLDCDDMDAEPGPVPPPRSHRRLRIVRTIGSGAADQEEMRVACPLRDKWPTFDECLECASWRGYSLDPRGKSSFVTCGELDPPRPIPADACVRGRALRTRVSEVMSDPICVRESVTLDELATIFVSNGISGAPVVDAEGKPVGVVTKTDIVEARAGHIDGEPGERGPDGFQVRSPSTLTAHELMTPVPIAIDAESSLTDAVAIMEAKRIHRLPVTSASGHVVGILTTLDIARWLNTPTGGAGPVCPAGL